MSPKKIERKASVVLVGFYRTWFLHRETELSTNDVAAILGMKGGIDPGVLDYLTSNGWVLVVREGSNTSLRLTAKGIERGRELVEAGFGTADA